MFNFILQPLLSIISAILYRLGGSSKADQDKEFPYIPRWFKNIPKKRDVMANITCLFSLFLLGINAPFWVWFISFGLLWASLSTYWDFLFGYDNFFMHSFMIAFSFLPIVIWGNMLFVPFLIRCILLSLLVGTWSKYHGNATVEELGRGGLITFSNIIFLLLK